MKLIDLSIDEARRIKWEAGRLKYGGVFRTDPLEELHDELIDAMNYAEEAARQGIDLQWVPERLLGLCEVIREMRKERLCPRVQTVAND